MNDSSPTDPPAPTSDPGSTVDSKETFYSVWVPKPLPATTLPGTGGYLRIGAVDDLQEKQLPKDPTVPVDKNAPVAQVSPFQDGILLYSTGLYQCVAQTAQVAAKVMMHTLIDNGGGVASASVQDPAGVNTTFQLADALTASMGNTTSSMVGSQLTHTTVSNSTISTLGRLVSNLGATTNVFGGTVMNVTGRGVVVQGARAYSNFAGYQLSSVGRLSLAAGVAPDGIASAKAWAAKLSYAVAILNVAATGTATAWDLAFETTGKGSGTEDQNAAVLRQLNALHYTFDGAAVLVLVAHVGMLLVGAMLQKTKFPTDVMTSSASIELSSIGIILKFGINSVEINATGIKLKGLNIAAESTQSLKMSNVVGLDNNGLVLDVTGARIESGRSTSLRLTNTTAAMAVGTAEVSVAPSGIGLAASQTRHLLFAPVVPNAPPDLSSNPIQI